MAQEAPIAQCFRRSKRISRIVTVCIGALVGLVQAYVSDHFEAIVGQQSVYLGIWAGLGIAGSLLGAGFMACWSFNLIVLRCPSCKRYVGMGPANYCRSCGIALR